MATEMTVKRQYAVCSEAADRFKKRTNGNVGGVGHFFSGFCVFSAFGGLFAKRATCAA